MPGKTKIIKDIASTANKVVGMANSATVESVCIALTLNALGYAAAGPALPYIFAGVLATEGANVLAKTINWLCNGGNGAAVVAADTGSTAAAVGSAGVVAEKWIDVPSSSDATPVNPIGSPACFCITGAALIIAGSINCKDGWGKGDKLAMLAGLSNILSGAGIEFIAGLGLGAIVPSDAGSSLGKTAMTMGTALFTCGALGNIGSTIWSFFKKPAASNETTPLLQNNISREHASINSRADDDDQKKEKTTVTANV